MMARDTRADEEHERDDDDEWLRALGAVAREERAALADAVPAAGPFSALDGDERAAIVEAIRAAQARAVVEADDADDAGADDAGAYDAGADDAAGAGDAGVELPAGAGLPLADVARPRPPRRWAAVAAVATALAAAVVFWVAQPSGPGLPAYTLEASAGAQVVRGEEAATATYAPGTRFRFVLRPAAAPGAAVEASVALSGPAGPVAWRPDVAVGPGGGVKIEGVFDGALALPPGVYTAAFTVRAGDESRTLKHRFEMRAE